MKQIVWGIALILLDLELPIGPAVELLPDFLGYYLLWKGCMELASQWKIFGGLRRFAGVAGILTLALFGAELFGFGKGSVQRELLFWGLGLAETIMGLAAARWVARGVTAMDPAQGQKLLLIWGFLAAMQGICWLLVLIPVVGTVGSAASFVMGLCYLVPLLTWKKQGPEGN